MTRIPADGRNIAEFESAEKNVREKEVTVSGNLRFPLVRFGLPGATTAIKGEYMSEKKLVYTAMSKRRMNSGYSEK